MDYGMVAHDLSRSSLVLACVVPVLFTLAPLLVSRASPFRAAYATTVLSVGVSSLAVLLRGMSAAFGGATDASFLRGLFELDLASSAMLVLVCTLSVVVVRYSQRYLAGEKGLVRYARSLLLTLASVTVLVVSNHLGLLVAAWIGAGVGLHQLLVFYRGRRQAVIVAHKKFLLARVADLCFFGSLVLLENDVRSLHIDALNAYAEAHATLSPSLHVATVLLVLGVLLKTAQLPFHGWILQVMEAPTPVSALLHAGVVNIGGFVMIRLAPLMGRAFLAQGLLVGVGLVTAIVGSLVMTTRASIKVTLAWSTIAQMGFMLVQCGLGVWHLALLHLLAHSLYKAHAFLSAGAVVDTWRSASLTRTSRPSLVHIAAALFVIALFAAPLYAVFALTAQHVSPSLGPLALALALGFVPMMARALAAGRRALALAALSAAGATASYFAWHVGFEAIAPAIDHGATSPIGWTVVVVGLVALFLAQTVLQTHPTGRLGRLLQPHLRGGLYLDDWFTRMTFRLWPPRLERPASTSRRSSITMEAR